MKPIEMLICSGCGEYAGSHIDAVIGGLQVALSEAIALAERAEAELSKFRSMSMVDFASWHTTQFIKKIRIAQ